MIQRYTASLLLIFFFASSFAQSSDCWTSIDENSFIEKGERQIIPNKYKIFKLDITKIQEEFDAIPLEYNTTKTTHQLKFPMPDGSIETFKVVESPVMEAGLSVKFPEIKSYLGQGIDNPRASVRFGWTYKGFHAMVTSEKGSVFIDPYSKDDQEHYVVYYKKDYTNNHQFSCGVHDDDMIESHDREPLHHHNSHKESGDELRTYRIAISCTGEYAAFHGGTVNAVMSELAVLMNRVNGVYETEVAIRMILVANNDQLIYLNSGTDPFSNNSAGQLINQNQTVIDNTIGSANYDIGHVVSTGGGGLAQFGATCINGGKARGVTGLPSPIGDPFYVDYVCHEIGHQFRGAHTFNGNTGSCAGGNRSANSAYEPGSGTTIMAYAGICGNQNIQNNSNDYFHTRSFDQIVEYSTVLQGSACPVVTQTGNNEPVVTVGTGNFFIPMSTPFELTGTATDPEGDPLTYCWEQFDLGPAGHPNSPTGNAPLFRSFSPVTTPSRTFPRRVDLLTGLQTIGERLPDYERQLSFRLTARDNKAGGGGVNYDVISFNVTDDAGPFLVTEPNTSNVVWTEGVPAQVTWDVANTDVAPVNCQDVDIVLSTDAGLTYAVPLATNVPNNGTALVLVPQGTATTQARARVQCATNIFFDVSDRNFTIQAPTAPGFAFWALDDEATICAPDDAQFSLDVISLLNFSDAVDISAENLPTGLQLNYNSNPITPGQNLEITATNTADVATGTYPIKLVATSGNITDSTFVYLTVYSQIPTIATLSTPEDGTTNVASSPTLTWEEEVGHTYQIQVASDVNFDNIVVDASGITENEYTAQGLNGYTIYYWHVKADNQCTNGVFSAPFTFRTSSSQCTVFGPGNPRNIAASLALVYPSELTVTDDFEIADLNVRNVEGNHTRISDLTFSLRSPQGTEVRLMDRICSDQDDFDIDFDDAAASGTFPCPPTDGQAYRPEQLLANFNGQNTAGTWTLLVEDHVSGSGGRLNTWELEICQELQVNNEDPIIVKNEGLTIFAGSGRDISNELLQATDADHSATDLRFTIVSAPAQGRLSINGTDLTIGSTFTQAEIDNGGLAYQHNGTGQGADGFRFHVDDGAGGWAGSPEFVITIDADSNPFDLEDDDAWLYPNPTAATLNVHLRLGQDDENLSFHVYNSIGQLVMPSLNLAGQQGVNLVQLETNNLSNGVYFLEIKGSNGLILAEKFVVNK